MTREELRQACLERLDSCALEHPCGHQGKLAARYVLRTSGQGETIELMFEKGPKSPPNLWVAEQLVIGLLADPTFEFRHAPAAALFMVKGKDGQPQYGRHAGLKPMKQLSHIDLVCFRINTIGQLDRILNHIIER